MTAKSNASHSIVGLQVANDRLSYGPSDTLVSTAGLLVYTPEKYNRKIKNAPSLFASKRLIKLMCC